MSLEQSISNKYTLLLVIRNKHQKIAFKRKHSMNIKGTINRQNLSGGFWGIIDEQGNKWKPVKMPTELQKEGLKVEVKAKKVVGGMSIFMWGTTVEILEFTIVT